MKKLLLAVLLFPGLAAAAYEVNGVALGGKEVDVLKAFPSARCKPLEWKSDAADRRCDDAQISLGGTMGKVTVFLKAGVIQAMDLRFDIKDVGQIKQTLRSRWGEPQAEATETFTAKDKKDRSVFKMRWEKGADQAVFTAQMDKKRATLEISRGNFLVEIYRVK